MASPTPGPYTVVQQPYSSQLQIRDEAEEIIIAAIPEKGDKLRARADARLLAASWEMREQLRIFAESDLIAELSSVHPWLRARQQDARRLLAKIDGTEE